ncbi:MAG: class I SAM-dependent methyltransferase [Pseudomonadota bacterium]
MTVRYRDPVEFYRDHATRFDAARSRALCEKLWLEDFLALVPRNGTVLDAGCGAGEPITDYIASMGFQITGLDASEPLLALARERVPGGEFVRSDLRTFDLDRTFDGIIAWDSVFHLDASEQARALKRFARHGTDQAALMFTSGPERGEAINPMFDEPLFHASLAPSDYEERLAALGFSVLKHVESDPDCGNRTIWLAKRGERKLHD